MVQSQHSVARKWNEVLLDGIRNDNARPTVHARNLFHISAAMYDAWAAYDPIASTWMLAKVNHGYYVPFDGVPVPTDIEAARNEAISYAAYNLIKRRFSSSPGFQVTLQAADSLMTLLGYDQTISADDYSDGQPAHLGNYIANSMIAFGLQDGSNEQNNYANLFYEPGNPPMFPNSPGNPDIVDYNRWQPLALDLFIDQSGNEIPLGQIDFLSPEWGMALPFALREDELVIHNRDSNDYWVYHDPGPPPHLEPDGSGQSDEYKWNFELVAIWSAQLDPDDTTIWDISPNAIGNLQSLPTGLTEYKSFYDQEGGGDNSQGYALNPATGLPYLPQMVPRGDYARVLAEFWADGPDSETPPGHWFTLLNYVNDHPLLVKKFQGVGPVIDDLEWDVKAYFALGGAVHDAGIAAWGIKGYYDYIRPISAIRAMADHGQSTDSALSNYSPMGLPLVSGYIESVEAGDSLAGANNENLGKIKMKAWKGHPYIADPAIEYAGVDWILAENWWPYQRPTFVTPPFAGYISGHSTFSRAAAEVLTLLTGDPFFPGGMGEFLARKNEFLVFEDGPSMDIDLQWATYRDASDQCSLSRIWIGIHPPADDIPGRKIGEEIGIEAFALARQYFEGVITGLDNEPKIEQSFTIFPNPVNTGKSLTIKIDPARLSGSVEIMDMEGRIVYSQTASTSTIRVPIDQLKPGMYLVRHIHKTGISSGKFIIDY